MPKFDQAAADQLAADVAAATGQPTAPTEPPGGQGADASQSLRAELEQAKDRELRCRAELENYRKRATREMQDLGRYATVPLMRDLLPVLDNMDRAIEAAEKTHDTASLLEGIKIVAQQFEGVLNKHDCHEIQALGQPFDPHLHEAILQQPSDEHPANTVTHVAQSGYQLHDRVVRPSQVIVSSERLGDSKEDHTEKAAEDEPEE